MKHSDKLATLMAALKAAQDELPAVGFNAKNPFFGSDYADLGQHIRTIQPVLSKHGLVVVQVPVADEFGVGVESMLFHPESGEWLSEIIKVPLTIEAETQAPQDGKKKGQRSQAQLAGAHITYLRRYALATIAGAYAGDDDDGNLAPRPRSNGNPAATQQRPGAKPAAGAQKQLNEKIAAIVAELADTPFLVPSAPEHIVPLGQQQKADQENVAKQFLAGSRLSSSAAVNAVRMVARCYHLYIAEHPDAASDEAMQYAREHWREIEA